METKQSRCGSPDCGSVLDYPAKLDHLRKTCDAVEALRKGGRDDVEES